MGMRAMKPLIRAARTSRRWTRRTAVLVAVWMCAGPGASTVAAQTATVTTLKAAFLYNFAKFTEWPGDTLAPGQRLSLCVMGDASVADALERTILGRSVDGHELTVRIVKIDGPLRTCHLLYASGLDGPASTQLFQLLSGASVLTIGDRDAFAESGGVAQFILEGDRMRFAVNVASAKRAGLMLSSKLLALAQIVTERHHAER
jgi:hypothetical protein